MRLLRCSNDSILSFTSDLVGRDTIPQYAILSHTWQEDEEVTYDELMKGSCDNKAGYNKIMSCAQQAKRDGLEYFWVDTCCINKADKLELREAISSMFYWYQHASRCYVYLSDVVYSKRKADTELALCPWATAFRASRWFTRGWTLQELLAPRSVEFFSKEWRKLGDKASLQTHIHEATRIPKIALEGVPLIQFTIEERLKWNEHRETTDPEDRVYCLIGILGVQMTPFYGEGVHGAFERLMSEANILKKCLRDLHLSNPYNDKKRIEDTKGGLLQGSYHWVLKNDSFQQWRSNSQSRLLWIKGDAGKGKTMLVCGIVDELKKSTTALLSFFFCQGTDSRINSATSVLRGVIYQLVSQQPPLMSHLREKYDQAGSNLFEDANAWVALSGIFISMTKDMNTKTSYIIVDALDECVVDLPKLLDLIVRTTASSTHIKWLVSSRNEAHILQKFKALSDESKLSLELKQNAEQIAQAVDVFIDHKLSCIESLEEVDLRKQVQEELRRKANGTFLWVALIIQELEKPESLDPLAVVEEAPAGLHQLYDRMIGQIQRLPTKTADVCLSLLGTTVVAYRPLHLAEISSLCRLTSSAATLLQIVGKTIAMCGSFLTIRDEHVYLVHQSAKDYLSDKIQGAILPSYTAIHHDLYSQSLKLMFSTLKRDMYKLNARGNSIEDTGIPNLDPLATVRYSCVYWIDHLCDSQSKSWTEGAADLEVRDIVDKFIREKYLYWLEGLNLCKSVEKGVVSMTKLWSLVQEMGEQDKFTQIVQDARRFLMYHKGAIESHPLQVYSSALLFSPRQSLVRNLFQHEEPDHITIIPPMDDNWSTYLRTLEGHSDGVSSVAFSPDSARLASASYDSTIKIWDAGSGAYLQTLKGHSSAVRSVAFSSDSTRLASASNDSTIKIWDASSGTCLQTLEGHSHYVRSVAFSSDSVWLASASNDSTVKIWDASSGACLQTLEGHSSAVRSVAFSPDSARLASASNDSTIKIWDVSSGACLQTLEGHSSAVRSVAFSSDSTRLASASNDSTIKIWDASSGTCLQTLEGHSHYVRSVAFSSDSVWLASASNDSTIKIWDASSGACLQTLEGHSHYVRSVAFSPDSARLASASNDSTVKIWDASSGACLQTLEGHSHYVRSVTFSPDSARLVSASNDSTIKVWDASSGACLLTLEGHSHYVSSVAFSPDSTRLASASNDSTIKIWDASSGACLQTLEGHSDGVSSVAFSLDLAQLASASYDKTVKIWDSSSGTCLQTLEGHSHYVRSVAFSPDSARLASASNDSTVKIWDASSGAYLQTLEGHSDGVSSVAFSPDSARLASSSYDKTVKIWDASSGACLQTLEGHSDGVSSVAFSLDLARLASSSYDKTVKIWDVSSGACLQTLEGHSYHVSLSELTSILASLHFNKVGTKSEQRVYQVAAISSDNIWISSNSRHQLWLPAEYRPVCSASSSRRVCIGTGSGKVWICCFK